MCMLQALQCPDIVFSIWLNVYFNDAGKNLLCVCTSCNVACLQSFEQSTLFLQVRRGIGQRVPVAYPLRCPGSICLSFPALASRAPPQIYEALFDLRGRALHRLTLEFQSILQSTVLELGTHLNDFLRSFTDSQVLSLRICCKFSLGIKKSGGRKPRIMDERAVYKFMHDLLHAFSVDIECVYKDTLVTRKHVLQWCHSL